MHSLVEEQEDSGRPLSLVLVLRVDWNSASPLQALVVTVKMLVLSVQPQVSTEFNINYNICNDNRTDVELDMRLFPGPLQWHFVHGMVNMNGTLWSLSDILRMCCKWEHFVLPLLSYFPQFLTEHCSHIGSAAFILGFL